MRYRSTHLGTQILATWIHGSSLSLTKESVHSATPMFAKDLMSKYYALSAELGVRDDDDDDDDDMTIMITNMY